MKDAFIIIWSIMMFIDIGWWSLRETYNRSSFISQVIRSAIVNFIIVFVIVGCYAIAKLIFS